MTDFADDNPLVRDASPPFAPEALRCATCRRWPTFAFVVCDDAGAAALCHCSCDGEPAEVRLSAAQVSALRAAPPPATLIEFFV